MVIDLGLKDEKFIIDLNKLIYIEAEGRCSTGVYLEFRGLTTNDNPNIIYFQDISFDDAAERILRMFGNSFLCVKTCNRGEYNRRIGEYNRRIIINKDYITAVYACRDDKSITNIVLDRGVIPVDIDVTTVERLFTGELKYRDVYKNKEEK